MTAKEKESWFQNLWNRKVPQYLGTYFAVGFGLLQFFQYLTERFELSKTVETKFLIVWLVLVPAIGILIYFGDRLNPKTEKGLAKWPKFIVGGNVLLALVLAIFFGNSQEVQAEVVNLTNEDGEEIKAVVPVLKKVKTVANFQFENTTGDADQDWWGVAFSLLLEAALEQRSEFYVDSQAELDEYYDKLELEAFTVPNVGMQRKIAQRSRNDYFTRIAYSKEGDRFVLNGDLYSAKSGESIFRLEASENSPFVAIDKVKEQIYNNIPDPLELAETQVSLPSSALITSNIESLKLLTESLVIQVKTPNEKFDEVIDKVKSSIESDDSCAPCYAMLGGTLIRRGIRDEGAAMFKKAVKQASSLPQRMQFSYKQTLYGVTDNTEAYLKMLELNRKMFPYDFEPYRLLVELHKINYGIDSAKVLIREAIDNGNIEKGLLTMYDLQVENEEYLEAEKTLDKYTLEFPDREQDRKRYADIYEKQGKIEKAKEVLLEEELMNPFDNLIQRRLARLDFKDQNVSAAFERIEKGIQQSETLTDSLDYLRTKRFFHHMCGQVREALEANDAYDKNAIKKMPQINVLLQSALQKGLLYHAIDQSEKVNAVLSEANTYSPEATLAYNCLLQENALMLYEKGAIASDDYLTCGDFRKKYGEGYENYYNLMNAYRLKDFKKCLSILEQDENDKLKKLFVQGEFFIADIYFKNNDSESAKKILQKGIDQKTDNPIFYFRMAVILERENKKEAREYLDVAMKYWSHADEDFVLLKEANALSKRLLVLNKTEG